MNVAQLSDGAVIAITEAGRLGICSVTESHDGYTVKVGTSTYFEKRRSAFVLSKAAEILRSLYEKGGCN